MSPLKTALLVLLSPILLAFALILLALAVVWAVVGSLFEYPTNFSIAAAATLAGLAVATDFPQRTPWNELTWDAALLAAVMLAAAVLASRGANTSDRQSLLQSLIAAVGAMGYAAVKAAVHPTTYTGVEIATLVLAFVAPVIRIVGILRLWRPAHHTKCAAWEARVYEKITTHVTFTQRIVAGMHTVEFAVKPGTPTPAGMPAPAAAPASSPAPAEGGAGAMPKPGAPAAGGGSAERPVLVVAHGYMSGTAMHMWQYEALTLAGFRVLAIDWLGCGGSERPPFRATSTEETENFFLDGLEKWRAAMGLERFVLMGHSKGGYLSACYTLRHPSRVIHLVLVSPGGIPSNGNDPVTTTKATGGMVRTDPRNPTPRAIPRWLWGTVAFLWESNLTPGQLVRFLGPCAPCAARAATRDRFRRLVKSRPLDGVTYEMGMWFYHNLASEGSGEYALKHIFLPGARARVPVGPRLMAAAEAGVPLPPVTFAYGGTHDWMSAPAGAACAEKLRSHGIRSAMHRVSPGGHHLYLESPDKFNAVVLEELAPTFPGMHWLPAAAKALLATGSVVGGGAGAGAATPTAPAAVMPAAVSAPAAPAVAVAAEAT